MRIRFRHLRLRVQTGEGLFGADIPLVDGLMVFRADNSRGKSTAMQSFLFALGLERMITAKPSHAVTSAMRDRLIVDPATKREAPVIESWVSLEIEGIDGQSATVTRWVTHDNFDTGLVRVAQGPALTEPGEYDVQDYYVGRAGAVANPRGFHNWLAKFIGWELPELPSADGRLVPLYMEQVFPLLFVEQRRGWGGIQAQMPYFSGVADVKRRAIEFLLKLDVGQLESQRLSLRAEEKRLQDEWRTRVKAFKEGISGTGLMVLRLPESLSTSWPLPESPMIAESRGEDIWVGIEEALSELRTTSRSLNSTPVRRVGEVADELESSLAESATESDALRQVGAVLREELIRDQRELAQVRSRLEVLRDDLREHQDILTLERLGSASVARLHGDCPVCHQELPESLLESDSVGQTLPPEQTVEYIRQQMELFAVMERDTELTVAAKLERLAGIRRRSAELSSSMRSVRAALAGPEVAPSEEDIARKVRVAQRIEELERVLEKFFQVLGELERISENARRVRGDILSLPKDRLSDSDKAKLDFLEQVFTDQLRVYDFGSFADERISVSRIDYLPRREEFDLQADISASDSIRVVWAYLLGLLETSGNFDTNHPGILIFDEPRQQSAKELSFAALLHRASSSSERQVIFATSEDYNSLRRMLDGVPHRLHAIEGYVLERISS